ncbi:MAG: hypothetical protein OXC68_00735 [Aestuariivita sp.]|nr:hypothetical protein [Aestuariivita sp.]
MNWRVWPALRPFPSRVVVIDHDPGIRTCGNAMVRKHRVPMAQDVRVRWLRHQPQSALSQWHQGYVSARDGRSRTRGIVAF